MTATQRFPRRSSCPAATSSAHSASEAVQTPPAGRTGPRSTDGGKTWTLEGTILPPTTDPETTNFLKLSLSPDGKTIYAYGSRTFHASGERFAKDRDVAVFCHSTNNGHTWSAPQVVPIPSNAALEISHGILPLSSGRLLAPAATFPSEDRLGEQVFVAVSDDGGASWPRHAVVFEDPDKRFGYLEQKLAEVAPGRVIATCWTTTLGDAADQADSFAISNDDGSTWGPAVSTGTMGRR